MDRMRSTSSAWLPETWLGLSGGWLWTVVLTIAALLACSTLLVYATGGTATAYPYFILVPVLLAAAAFGYKGGLACGLVAGLLLGPLMPMDVASGQAQSLPNWLTRVGIYLFLGGFTGWLFTRLHDHSRKLLLQAATDPVSGLPNRHSLQKDVAEMLSAGPRGTEQPSRLFVISIQLQNYQSTVSALGFAAEGPLLREMGCRLQKTAAPVDGRIYHVNDEHFAILLANRTRQECLETTRRAVVELQRPFDVWDVPVYLGAHAGVSSFPFHEREDPTRLITKAWMAMYEASAAGRTYASYNRRTDATSMRTVELLGELQNAITEDQLLLHYQPQVDSRDGQLIGVEALVRWQHPTRGLIPPGEFIPQAERTGLIHPLTRWVLSTAAREMAPLRRAEVPVPFSVNVSARNFLDPQFVDEVLRIASEAELEPGELELEFTETAVMTDPEDVIKRLLKLTEAGVSLAIDDFGTGHSSLAYLKRLPVSVLKIDQTFVRDMRRNTADAQITRASVALAHNLGLKSVAEGVEDSETRDLLVEMGCDAAQGYGIARPMPAAELLRWSAQSIPQRPLAEERRGPGRPWSDIDGRARRKRK